jgi:phage gpG-like protein
MAMKRATLVVQRDAKINAPVDTGRLRASITPDIRAFGGEVVGVVGSNVIYAPFQELPVRPHWPPLAALETWARRHGTTAYVVARAIARRGLPGKRFLQRAFEDNREKIKEILEKGVKGIVDE